MRLLVGSGRPLEWSRRRDSEREMAVQRPPRGAANRTRRISRPSRRRPRSTGAAGSSTSEADAQEGRASGERQPRGPRVAEFCGLMMGSGGPAAAGTPCSASEMPPPTMKSVGPEKCLEGGSSSAGAASPALVVEVLAPLGGEGRLLPRSRRRGSRGGPVRRVGDEHARCRSERCRCRVPRVVISTRPGLSFAAPNRASA